MTKIDKYTKQVKIATRLKSINKSRANEKSKRLFKKS